MSILLAVMATALFQQPSCEALKSVSLPNATITAANSFPRMRRSPRRDAVHRVRHCRRTVASQ